MRIPLDGRRVGRLLVVKENTERHQNGLHTWLCICDCGCFTNVLSANLVSGKTSSCGCLRKELTAERAKIHGLYKHPLYDVYHNMVKRCYCGKNINYYNYGGRGIKVCDRWLDSINNFIEDMSPLYKHGLTLDRINTNGNYEPSNCRWVTPQENSFNTRGAVKSSSKYKGVSWMKGRNKWRSEIMHNGTPYYLGLFADEVQAAIAYNAEAKKLFGEFAFLNDISI